MLAVYIITISQLYRKAQNGFQIKTLLRIGTGLMP